MPPRMASALSWGAFGVGYYACYFLSTAVHSPLLWYLPIERRFAFGTYVPGLAADYYGRELLCVVAGALAFVAARFGFGRGAAPSASRWLRVVTVWSAVLLALTASQYVASLALRHPTPVPLPPGYVPR